MRALLAVLVPISLAIAVMQLVQPFSSPVERNGVEAEAMVWGDRVFTSKGALSAWLQARGIDYDTWIARHPGAAPWEPDVAEQAAAASRPQQKRSPTPAAPSTKEPAQEAASPRVDSTASAHPLLAPLLGLLVVLALLLITASAIAPTRSAAWGAAGGVLVEHRAETAVAGLALLVGLSIPLLT